MIKHEQQFVDTLRIQLDALADEMMNVTSRINYGGCCVVASMVASKLEGMGIDAHVVVFDPDTDNSVDSVRDEIQANNAANTVSNWHSFGMGFYHVIAEFNINGKWYMWDAEEGMFDALMFGCGCDIPRVDGFLTVQEATELGSDSQWNHTFDRGYIPELQALADTMLDRMVGQ